MSSDRLEQHWSRWDRGGSDLMADVGSYDGRNDDGRNDRYASGGIKSAFPQVRKWRHLVKRHGVKLFN
jgi:hypothetical protein